MLERRIKISYRATEGHTSTMYADLDYDREIGAGIDKYTDAFIPVRWNDETEEWTEM